MMVRAACAVMAGLLFFGEATADRIHLREGGSVVTERWWVEGETLMYESPAGTIGIPRSLIRRIEPGSQGPTDSPPEGATGTRPGSDSPSRPAAIAPSGSLDRVAALVAEGAAALNQRDFETAASLFRRALDVDPSLAPARVGYAVGEMALGRNQMALPVVLDGLVRTPSDPQLLELLGDLHDREERVEDAVRSWREAQRVSPNARLEKKILKAERELEAGRGYHFTAGPHFNVRFDGQLDPNLAADITDYLEERYRELCDAFRHAPSQPITVLLYPKQEFRDVTQVPESVGGLYDGKIRVPLGGIRRLDETARRVLAHELTHAVIHSKTRGNCPRWLHEGLAQRSERRTFGAAGREEVARLLRAHDPADWDRGGFSYAAALSLTQYLESQRGFYAVVDLLDRLGEGSSLDEALVSVYGEPYASVCRRWAHHVLGGES